MVGRILRISAGAIQSATTTKPWSFNFRHMLPVSGKVLSNASRFTDTRIPRVPAARDRIKYWNIVPGDQVHVRGAPGDTLHTVKAINRFTNRVHMHGQQQSDDPSRSSNGPNVHYSKCQLYIGDYEFPPAPGSVEPITRRVFARRLGTSEPTYNTYYQRIAWNRYAVATDPPIPHMRKKKIPIPWPKREKPSTPKAELCDTPREEVARVTWRPPPFPRHKGAPIPQPPSEKEFLYQVINGIKTPFQPPVEMFLEKELTNHHGFAKRHERWMAYQAYKKTLLNEYIERELKELNGRTKGAARADATFKWRMRLDQERKQKVDVRMTFQKLKDERRTRRKIRKEQKGRERLANMVLIEAENQFIPPSMVNASNDAPSLHA